MNRKQSWHRNVLAVTAAVFFSMSLPAIAQQSAMVMKLGTATINEIQHDWLKRFAAEVEKNAGGRIKAEVYPASQLGSIPRMIEGTQFGSIQGWAGPPQFLAGIDSRFEVLSAPGMFKSIEHQFRVLQDPEFNSAFMALGANKGLKGIGLFTHGAAGFAMRTKTVKLADLEGKKIRVLASPMELEPLKRLKGTPVPMAFGEVLPALQQGTIDGALTAITAVSAMRWYDAAKFYLEASPSYIAAVTMMSKGWFDKLPADLQKVVVDAGQKVSRDSLAVQISQIKEHRENWTKNGGELAQLSPAEQEALAKSLASVGTEVTAKKPEEKALFDILTKVAKRHE
jgi:TRAP-type transport system periplasmic protein